MSVHVSLKVGEILHRQVQRAGRCVMHDMARSGIGIGIGLQKFKRWFGEVRELESMICMEILRSKLKGGRVW